MQCFFFYKIHVTLSLRACARKRERKRASVGPYMKQVRVNLRIVVSSPDRHQATVGQKQSRTELGNS